MFETTLPEQIQSHEEIRKLALAVIDTELKAIQHLRDRIDENFIQASEYFLNCQGRVVITGMGKSGHVGSKIAATLASTGTPAFFVHPGEALHGDMGMVTVQDCVLAISNSGETEELLTILPLVKRLDVPLITMTGAKNSTLAISANVNLDISVEQEACPLGLAPTASTTTTLVLGDALAIALLKARGFTQEDFAMSHPGGRLGKRLLIRVQDLMHTDHAIPKVKHDTLLPDTLLEVSHKRFGMTTVVDEHDRFVGIFTDGDLRRTLDNGLDIQSTPVSQIMSHNPKTISQNALASEALTLMETYKITSLVIPGANNQVKGIIHMHDLITAKIA